MTPVVLSDEALAEIAAAAHWYEERQQYLGDRFLDEVDHTTLRIAARPRGFSRIALSDATLDVRRALLDVFPYAVVFTSLPAEVRVLAVSHTRRNPEYWLHRLEP